MRRREFIALAGGFGATGLFSPLAQAQRMPVVGFLNTASPAPTAPLLAVFTKALSDAGFIDGKNIVIEYRWAQGQYERLEALAADIVRHNPSVIAATGGTVAAKAVKAVTSTIPVLFIAGFDPVKEGLVASINRPGGNATGVAVYTAELGKKRLEMLQQFVPGRPIAMLVNPNATSTAVEIADAESAAKILGFRLMIVQARLESEIKDAFEQAVSGGAAALLVSADSFFTSLRFGIVALAAQHRMPVCYPWPQYVEAGGLISYGTDLAWAYEKIGAYAGRLLKGEKPENLPVQLPTIFETIINMRTAKALSISIPPLLQAGTEKIIE
jgi:putative ABC transport system substrate-binding protein